MYRRHLSSEVKEALADTPVVFINGARQTGKSTLVRVLCDSEYPARYLTLDDPEVFSIAKQDPGGFVAGLEGPVAIDEVQRVPELFLPIKAAVDRDRRPGRFLLTGSADILMLPNLAHTLAGRMQIVTLWPLSQGELRGVTETFVDRVFSRKTAAPAPKPDGQERLEKAIMAGGFPEALTRAPRRRREWFSSYVTTMVQREVRELADVEGLSSLPRLLSLLSARIGGLMNVSELSRSLGIPVTTLRRYLALLEATFLLQPLPPWSGNLGKRLTKSHKIYLCDAGLAAHLAGIDEQTNDFHALRGSLVENFVVMELRKQCTWSETPRPSIFHFRSHSGDEVDIVMEDRSGAVVGIEVKARRSLDASDFRGLKLLQSSLGKKFIHGVVLYDGEQSIPAGAAIHALPIASLWSGS